MRIFKVILIGMMMICSVCFALDGDLKAQAKVEILNRLEKFPQDFNAKDLDKTCKLFAEDLIATFPGSKDRNYTEMCDNFKTIFADPIKTYHYDAPKIEQVIIDEDLAIVRLIWTLTATVNGKADVIKERGLDVFRRQKDGSWRLSISYAYPDDV